AEVSEESRSDRYSNLRNVRAVSFSQAESESLHRSRMRNCNSFNIPSVLNFALFIVIDERRRYFIFLQLAILVKQEPVALVDARSRKANFGRADNWATPLSVIFVSARPIEIKPACFLRATRLLSVTFVPPKSIISSTGKRASREDAVSEIAVS